MLTHCEPVIHVACNIQEVGIYMFFGTKTAFLIMKEEKWAVLYEFDTISKLLPTPYISQKTTSFAMGEPNLAEALLLPMPTVKSCSTSPCPVVIDVKAKWKDKWDSVPQGYGHLTSSQPSDL